MNEYIDKSGRKFVAVPSQAKGSCEGCFHTLCDAGCVKVPHCCAANDREDGVDIVWVDAASVPPDVTPVKVELTFSPTDRIDAVRNTVARLRAVYEPHFTVGKTEITQRDDCTIVSIPLSVKL